MDPELVSEPERGRIYRSERRIRLADAAPDGRLRLDAMARYMQDVASDDVADSGADDEAVTWVVRRTRIDVVNQFGADHSVALATWASGSGSHCAARRTRIRGDAGGRAEAESLWVLIDRASGRLARLTRTFEEIYAESTAGRRVSGRLELGAQPSPDSARVRWPLRDADIDLLGHANNAVYWAAVESALRGGTEPVLSPLRGTLEYRRPVDLTTDLELAIARRGSVTSVWFVDGRETAASGTVRSLDA